MERECKRVCVRKRCAIVEREEKEEVQLEERERVMLGKRKMVDI